MDTSCVIVRVGSLEITMDRRTCRLVYGILAIIVVTLVLAAILYARNKVFFERFEYQRHEEAPQRVVLKGA